ncbi:phosphoglycerate kinase [Chitinivibrio alkaliphilus ACht1]|uniref:Phosphoglycerate kinase n=1 Tax=Chitinivibrio alkaliphilus ACht1 TaxID=1313304 RepID=U7D5S2_9BACT|nr:phosphoglycerate kinase [Chitinivibrio alkaliphilus]ERP30901.1 phosphoglycerate kinase [Chitinivibrio alkaliphilus ACht1]
MDKLFVEDLAVRGKKVIVRVDFNVPLNGNQEITDDKRIVASLPTIKYLVSEGAKVILMSHLGRPKGEIKPEFSLKPVADALPRYIDGPVHFVNENRGGKVQAAADALKEGEVLLIENLRFDAGETGNDPAFAKDLASLADLYVNDAFGTAHRAHASTAGITEHFEQPACGYLLKKEIDFLGNSVAEPKRPFVAIIGGAKVSSKIGVIEALLPKVDKIIIGGGMAYTFYKAQGLEIGDSICEDDKVDLARELLDKAGTKIYLPEDTVITSKLDFKTLSVADTSVVTADQIPVGMEGCDIGPRSIATFSNVVREAKTVLWNGPMGVFEIDETAKGTFAVADALVEATDDGAITIIGGGDSAAAIAKAGLSDRVSHVSTGGGASLEFLEGKKASRC